MSKIPGITYKQAKVNLVTNVEIEPGAIRCGTDKQERMLIVDKIGIYGQDKVLWSVLSFSNGLVFQIGSQYIIDNYPYTVYEEHGA